VVEGVRDDQAVGYQLRHGGDAGLVRDVAGGENQRRFLAVQVGKLVLELHQRMVGAGNIAGAARPGAHPRRRLHHGADHLRVLAHAEIVVGTPYDDVAPALRGVPHSMGEPSCQPFEIGKHAVTPLVVQLSKGVSKKCLVIHRLDSPRAPRAHFRSILLDLFLERFQAVCRGDKCEGGHAPPWHASCGQSLALNYDRLFQQSAIMPTICHDVAELRSAVSHPTIHTTTSSHGKASTHSWPVSVTMNVWPRKMPKFPSAAIGFGSAMNTMPGRNMRSNGSGWTPSGETGGRSGSGSVAGAGRGREVAAFLRQK